MNKIYRRWALEALERYLNYFRVVCVLGPRQCGKSTMLEHSNIANSLYKTLDNVEERIRAKDVNFFLKSKDDGTLIIDEVQREPDLILGIKRKVDVNNRPGQFILAGSADYRSIPSVNESLAGRAAIVNMRPLSQGEIRGTSPQFLDKLFRKEFDFALPAESFGKLDLFDFVIRGGFPEVQSFPEDVLTDWFSMYVENQVMRDMAENKLMRNSRTAGLTFMKSLALLSGSVRNLSDLSQDTGLNRVTVKKYTEGLETLFLINEIPSWTRSPAKGLRKKPKLFMTDSGLMAFLLGIRSKLQILEGLGTGDKRWGALVETWVYNQIAPEIDLRRGWHLYHWRNQENQEIDFLVENEKGEFLGIEVKASETVHSEDFKHLENFQSQYPEFHFVGVVLYAGREIVQKSENLVAIPMNAMWSESIGGV